MQYIDLVNKLPKKGSWKKRALDSIKAIAIHHDAGYTTLDYDPIRRYKAQALSHINRGWVTLSYHYKIDVHGQLYRINYDDDMTWTTANNNDYVKTMSHRVCCE